MFYFAVVRWQLDAQMRLVDTKARQSLQQDNDPVLMLANSKWQSVVY